MAQDTFAPEGMRLKEVFKFDNGQLVDLVVKTIDGAGFQYVPRIPEKNGARDGFGSINMELGAKAKFSFFFVDSVDKRLGDIEGFVVEVV